MPGPTIVYVLSAVLLLSLIANVGLMVAVTRKHRVPSGDWAKFQHAQKVYGWNGTGLVWDGFRKLDNERMAAEGRCDQLEMLNDALADRCREKEKTISLLTERTRVQGLTLDACFKALGAHHMRERERKAHPQDDTIQLAA